MKKIIPIILILLGISSFIFIKLKIGFDNLANEQWLYLLIPFVVIAFSVVYLIANSKYIRIK